MGLAVKLELGWFLGLYVPCTCPVRSLYVKEGGLKSLEKNYPLTVLVCQALVIFAYNRFTIHLNCGYVVFLE